MAFSLRACLVPLLATVTASGCATHQHATMTDRFVHQGEPSIDLGGPSLAMDTNGSGEQLRKAAEDARPRPKSVSVPLAETTDPQLKARLAALGAAPSAEAHQAVATEYQRLGILDMAHRHVSAAIDLAPKNATLRDHRARIWRAWGMPRMGIADARKAVKLAPRSATARNTLGLLLEGSGALDEAISAYQRAVKLDEGAGYAWNNLCRAWTERGSAIPALKACRQALRLGPSSRHAELNLRKAERMVASLAPGALPVIETDGPTGDLHPVSPTPTEDSGL